jgi:hypothetical protein
MFIFTNNNNNNNDDSNIDRVPQKVRCTMCGRIRTAEKAEIYYNSGNTLKMRLAYLCNEVINTIHNPAHNLQDCCYYRYYKDLGYTLTVADWAKISYDTILSIFISSPLIHPSSDSSSSSIDTTNTATSKLKGGGSITFETAVHVAYTISDIVRQYLTTVDKEIVPDVLNVNLNPRLHPIRYRLLYKEPLVTKVCDEPLTFRWNCNPPPSPHIHNNS